MFATLHVWILLGPLFVAGDALDQPSTTPVDPSAVAHRLVIDCLLDDDCRLADATTRQAVVELWQASTDGLVAAPGLFGPELLDAWRELRACLPSDDDAIDLFEAWYRARLAAWSVSADVDQGHRAGQLAAEQACRDRGIATDCVARLTNAGPNLPLPQMTAWLDIMGGLATLAPAERELWHRLELAAAWTLIAHDPAALPTQADFVATLQRLESRREATAAAR